MFEVGGEGRSARKGWPTWPTGLAWLAGGSALVGAALRRLLHDRLVAGATAALVVVGLVQLTATPIYTEAVTLGALRWSATSAPAEETTIRIGGSTAPETAAALDRVAVDAGRSVDPRARIVRRLTTGTFQLPTAGAEPVPAGPEDAPDGSSAGEAEAKTDVTVLASVTGLEDHATLTDGRWPGDGEASADDALPAALQAGVAERLGLELGQRLDLESTRGGQPLAVEVVGLYRIDDPIDRFWTGDPLLVDGVVDGRNFRTIGPLVVPEGDLLGGLAGRLSATWLIDPELGQLTTADAEVLAARVSRLPDRVAEAVADLPAETSARIAGVQVDSGLPAILEGSSRSVTVTRSGVLAVAAQLSVLAGLALAAGARLLVEARRAETELLRSRGGGRAQLVALTAIEAVVLVVPAAVVAPRLASVALRALGRWGPLASVGFPIEPRPTAEAAAVAAVTAAVMLALLVAPAIRSAGEAGPALRHRRQSRRSTAQRAGLDLALVVLTAGALWQLGRLGTGADSVLADRFAVDPLLVVAPALALLTGAVASLRLVPLLAAGAERLAARGRSVVATLAGWQVARRPADQARSMFLLALAVAIGAFAAAYAATWRGSQDDQATHRTGADLRVSPDRRVGEALPSLHLVTAHDQVDGIAHSLPVTRLRAPFPSTDEVTLVALDADRAPAVVTAADRDRATIEAALATLVAERTGGGGLGLPGEPVDLTLPVVVDEEPVLVPLPVTGGPEEATGETGEGHGDADDPAGEPPGEPEMVELAPALGGAVEALVRDGSGLLHRLELGTLTPGQGTHELRLDLAGEPVDGRPVEPAWPLTVVGVEVRMPIPDGPSRSADVAIGPVRLTDGAGQIVEVPLAQEPGGGAIPWRATAELTSRVDQPPTVATAPAATGPPGALRLEVETGASSVPAVTVLDLRPDPVSSATALPIVVSTDWLDETGGSIGDAFEAPGLPLPSGRVRVVGTVDGFPTVDPGREQVVLADLATLQAVAVEPGRPLPAVDEVWLTLGAGVDGAARQDLSAALSRPPFDSASVDDRAALAARLRADPVALAAIGAYTIGAAAAAALAVVVFATAAAMSARQRRGEFTLLRALGLSPRQFGAWMAVEQLALLATALLLGTRARARAGPHRPAPA